MKNLRFLLPITLIALAPVTLCAADATRTQLLQNPPVKLAERLARDSSDVLRVDYTAADLDGSRQFRFVIALYSLDSTPGAFLRVFRRDAAGLTLVGEQEDQNLHGGWGLSWRLVDIDGDRTPEIELSGTEADGSRLHAEYFRWTSAALHWMNSSEDSSFAVDARLEDIDGDGVLELIIPVGSKFKIFRLSGNDFVFSSTVASDPTGLLGADGKIHLTRAQSAEFHPAVVTLGEMAAAADQESKIKLLVGGLIDTGGEQVSVDQIDPNSLIVGTRTRPVHVSTLPASDAHLDPQRGTVLIVELRRADFLRALPGMKLEGPLSAGDNVRVTTTGRLRDGTRFCAIAMIAIQGSR